MYRDPNPFDEGADDSAFSVIPHSISSTQQISAGISPLSSGV
jgi:hypothetical protein